MRTRSLLNQLLMTMMAARDNALILSGSRVDRKAQEQKKFKGLRLKTILVICSEIKGQKTILLNRSEFNCSKNPSKFGARVLFPKVQNRKIISQGHGTK